MRKLVFLLFATGVAVMFFLLWQLMPKPVGRALNYEGFVAKTDTELRIDLLVVERYAPSIYIELNGVRQLPSNLTVKDIVNAGFTKQSPKRYDKERVAIVYFDDRGTFSSMSIYGSEIGVSTTFDGKLLKFPVGYRDFLASFGEPIDWEYIYPDSSMP